MRKRKKSVDDGNFWDSAWLNSATYQQYYNRLTELAISMFDWKNVPDTIDVRFLELTLFGEGLAVFFFDPDMGDKGEYLALKTMIGGQLNVYQIPNERRAFASNGYNKPLDSKNSVIIFNNYLHTNSMLDVQMFARRLANLDRAIDVNANAQKTPLLIECEDSQRLTMKNLYMQYDGNMPVIFGRKGLDAKGLSVLKTDAPYVADKLYQLKSQLWNEALTYLGISNTNVTKKERMISDEVMRNMGGVIASRYSRLESRREACEQINKMFGLDISVEYRSDYREADDELMLSGETGDGSKDIMVTDTKTRTTY